MLQKIQDGRSRTRVISPLLVMSWCRRRVASAVRLCSQAPACGRPAAHVCTVHMCVPSWLPARSSALVVPTYTFSGGDNAGGRPVRRWLGFGVGVGREHESARPPPPSWRAARCCRAGAINKPISGDCDGTGTFPARASVTPVGALCVLGVLLSSTTLHTSSSVHN
jgi:hypothetical protein